jgi:hypothetical protein
VLDIARRYGWLPGARYTNLRDIRAVQITKPLLTVARDVLRVSELDEILREAESLSAHCGTVIIVPKDPRLRRILNREIPDHFRLGYSVPTRYGQSAIETKFFRRPVHLLGGRPDVQRQLANELEVASLDCNRFTLDAAFGDYFDGETFRPHPIGGYERCLQASLQRITELWQST